MCLCHLIMQIEVFTVYMCEVVSSVTAVQQYKTIDSLTLFKQSISLDFFIVLQTASHWRRLANVQEISGK